MRHYHVTGKDLGKTVTLAAKIPENRGHEECAKTLRVCFAPTVWQCLASRIGADCIGDIVSSAWDITSPADRKAGKCNNMAVYYTDETLFKPKQVSDFGKTGERWYRGDIKVTRVGFVSIKDLMLYGSVIITNRRQSSVSTDFYKGWSQGVCRGRRAQWYDTPPHEPLTMARRGCKR